MLYQKVIKEYQQKIFKTSLKKVLCVWTSENKDVRKLKIHVYRSARDMLF